MILGDGRNFLLNEHKKFDIITIDPAPPIHRSGTVNLYTQEFLQLCAKRLSENGTFCLWIPDGFKSELSLIIKTQIETWPFSYFWVGPLGRGFYCIGRHVPIKGQMDEFYKFFDQEFIKKDLNKYGKAMSLFVF